MLPGVLRRRTVDGKVRFIKVTFSIIDFVVNVTIDRLSCKFGENRMSGL